MVLCVAFGCNSRSEKDNVSFFQFPKDEKLKKLWIEKLNRGKTTTQQFAPTVHHKLCSKHFEDNQFKISPSLASNIGYECNFRLRLKDEAVPTIFETSTIMTAEKRPTTERQSAKKIREKKLKLEVQYCFCLWNIKASIHFTQATGLQFWQKRIWGARRSVAWMFCTLVNSHPLLVDSYPESSRFLP